MIEYVIVIIGLVIVLATYLNYKDSSKEKKRVLNDSENQTLNYFKHNIHVKFIENIIEKNFKTQQVPNIKKIKIANEIPSHFKFYLLEEKDVSIFLNDLLKKPGGKEEAINIIEISKEVEETIKSFENAPSPKGSGAVLRARISTISFFCSAVNVFAYDMEFGELVDFDKKLDDDETESYLDDLFKIKIIRHHDYGMALDSMPNEKGIINDKMYFCFFKLDNGKTLCVHTYKSFNEKTKTYEWNEFGSVDEDGNDILTGHYNITYANDYTFGENFHDWQERSTKIKYNKRDKWPTIEEENLVIDFYENNIKHLYD